MYSTVHVRAGTLRIYIHSHMMYVHMYLLVCSIYVCTVGKKRPVFNQLYICPRIAYALGVNFFVHGIENCFF